MQYAIYFRDLIPEAQEEVLDFYGIKKEEDGNFGNCPIVILEREIKNKEYE